MADVPACMYRCEHDEAQCPVDWPGDRPYGCTLPRGHVGDHVACDIEQHDLAVWPQLLRDAGVK